ncbi:hypothetical protein HYU15_00340 [Candidatus Woesearchaeota archaeon]|nr:hypothetical protein [Candidatus Woesearchaeota archaeon]
MALEEIKSGIAEVAKLLAPAASGGTVSAPNRKKAMDMLKAVDNLANAAMKNLTEAYKLKDKAFANVQRSVIVGNGILQTARLIKNISDKVKEANDKLKMTPPQDKEVLRLCGEISPPKGLVTQATRIRNATKKEALKGPMAA